MAGEGYQVNAERLDAHVARLEQIAGDIGTAKSAANAVRLDIQAYGHMCTVVPIMINVLGDLVRDGFEDAIQSLRHNADQMKVMASRYREAEEQTQQRLERLQRSIGRRR
jgi:uncharacterized protein YukE